MRVVCIADTHGKHDEVIVPDGDLLIHAGDCTSYGHSGDLKDFLKWFAALPHCNKVLIAGNHDWIFEREPIRARTFVHRHAPGVNYLENSGVRIRDLQLWGSPFTPPFMDWAFNRDDEARRAAWGLIPENTDILVTHGPVFGGRDWAPFSKEHVGDKTLLDRLNDIYVPLHICGHIHHDYGSVQLGKTCEINASVVNEAYEVVNEPIVVDTEEMLGLEHLCTYEKKLEKSTKLS